MDELSKTLHSYLVKMAYEGAPHEQEHKMEHLLALLFPEDEQALISYYGIFGEPRLSLDEIAEKRKETPEQTMEAIDKCIRKLAVTPEWQMINEKL
ncbi:histidinol dehydrogenase [Prevotella sp. E9-3]|uniref:histidinol dehydrogenase n=1 Tax=Prevotella sp. E9-3 TaxID=2913621 RepID=UPI001EDAB788|nr:histidinol dehydrogenase [Prevotella sp. E9-3]UKK47664.1 histidinol dehydrogenase [Prevotella sp. E9-3]